MRNAIVENLGALICDQIETAAHPKDVDQAVDGFFDVLLQRTEDMSSYVCARAYQMFTKVLVVAKSRHCTSRRMEITTTASHALADKVVIAKVSSQDSVSSKVTVADMYLVALLSLFACRGGDGTLA